MGMSIIVGRTPDVSKSFWEKAYIIGPRLAASAYKVTVYSFVALLAALFSLLTLVSFTFLFFLV